MGIIDWIMQMVDKLIKLTVKMFVMLLHSFKLAVLEALAPYSPTFAAMLAAEKLKLGMHGTFQELLGHPGDLIKAPFEIFGHVANNLKAGKLPIPLPIPSIFDKDGVLSKLPIPIVIPKLPIPSIFSKDGEGGIKLPIGIPKLPISIPKVPIPIPQLPIPLPKLPIPSIFNNKDTSNGIGSILPIPLPIPKLPIPSIFGKGSDSSSGEAKLPLPIPIPIPKLPFPSIFGKSTSDSSGSDTTEKNGPKVPIIPIPKLPIPPLFGKDTSSNASSDKGEGNTEKPALPIPLPIPKLPIPKLFDKDSKTTDSNDHKIPLPLPLPKLSSLIH